MILYISSNKIVKYADKLIKEKDKEKNRKIEKKGKLADYEEVVRDCFG